MSRRSRTTVLALAGVAALVTAAAASAHAIVSPAVALDKKLQQFTLSVPTEKEGLTTTEIELTVPSGFAIDSFEPAPAGWKQQVQSTGSGEDTIVQKVTWTGGHVPTDEDAVFRFNASTSGAKTYTFDVRQTYSDGSVVEWTGPETSDTPAPDDRGALLARRRQQLDARDRRTRGRDPRAARRDRRPRHPRRPVARMRRALVASAAVAAALTAPAAASAHAGTSAPVATNFDARIVGFRPPAGGLEAKVVDGDRKLWLRVPAGTTVVVPGLLGEPVLRFDAKGVWVNLRSLTAQTDRIDRFDLRPSANARARPLWHRLTGGHAVRLARAPAARARAARARAYAGGDAGTVVGAAARRRPPPHR